MVTRLYQWLVTLLLLASLWSLHSRPLLAETDQPAMPAADTAPPTTIPQIFWSTTPDKETRVVAGGVELVSPGPADSVDLIVVLADEPLSVYQQPERHMNESSRQNRETALVNQANLLARQQQGLLQTLQRNGWLQATRQQYRSLLNGLAISAPLGRVEQIKQLPGVKAVFPDYQARITLNTSVPLMGAPAVWAQTVGGVNVRGQGMRIAIIDTGIDYTHPDLGGCLGAGCRVIDGWDFVNNDNNPLDDHSHGTHVAGIVAANGTLKGVAPEARLLAYKVCDSGGSCAHSAILAALERAADPDNNPATADAVHVINMSLGGPGTPDDPVAMATNNAVAQGIVVVAAAGNAGANYRTIGSPGAAAQAITVGATDKNDAMAYFSSRGWVGNYLIKPDLTAPGVAINAPVLQQGYATYDGTSMAAPHVAGAAALLRQAHPTWTPAQIKAALMNNTLDVGQNPFAQGTGRVRVDQALNPNVLLLPGSLSFGRVDPTQTLWSKSLAIQVQNPTANAQSYQLTVNAGLPAGLSATLSQNQVTVAAGQSLPVTLTVTVDNGVLPFQSDPSFAYGGAVQVSSGAGQQRVPFALVKATELAVTLDPNGEGWFVWLRNHAGGEMLIDVQGQTQMGLPVTPGVYDLVVAYPTAKAFVVQENVQVNNDTALTLLSSQATHLLTTNFQNFTNQVVTVTQRDQHYFRHKGSPHGFMITGSIWSGGPVRFSTISSAYYIETCTYQRNYPAEQSVYDLCYPLDGINATQTQQLNAQNLKKLTVTIEAAANAANALPGMSYRNSPYTASGTWGTAADWLTAPFVRTFYFTPLTSPYATARDLMTEQKTANETQLPRVWSSRLRFPNRTTMVMDLWNYNPVTKNWDEEQLTTTTEGWRLASAPVYWAGHFRNSATAAQLGANALWSPFDERYLFLRDQYQNSLLDQRFPYTLTTTTGTTTGLIVNNSSLPIATGPITVQVGYTFRFLNQTGQGSLIAAFNSAQSDKNPPLISELKVLDSNGMRSNMLEQSGSVAVRVQDDGGVATVALAVNYQDGQGWRTLNPTLAGGFYSAALPAYSGATTTPVALKIVAVDQSGNQLTNQINPAFTIKAAPAGLPDLVITAVTFADNCSATFTIANQGAGNASQHFPFTAAQLYVPAWGVGPQTGWSATIVGLPAGQTTTQSWLNTRVFGAQIALFVDPQKQIAESNETNNQVTFPAPAHCQYLPSDLGDAPDSANHAAVAMNAYPGVAAKYPVTYDDSGVRGPLHRTPYTDSWLGAKVSGEKDADLTPDGDSDVTNLAPVSALADRDLWDDGLLLNSLTLPNCATTQFSYKLTIVGAKRTRYANAWIDFNRDGDWEDTFYCKVNGQNKLVKEWAVVNQSSNLVPGAYTITTPTFWSAHPTTVAQPLWLRLMLSEGKATTIPGATKADGRGPAAGYQFGETEDYLLTPTTFVTAATATETAAPVVAETDPTTLLILTETVSTAEEAVAFVESEAIDITATPAAAEATIHEYPAIEGQARQFYYLPLLFQSNK